MTRLSKLTWNACRRRNVCHHPSGSPSHRSFSAGTVVFPLQTSSASPPCSCSTRDGKCRSWDTVCIASRYRHTHSDPCSRRPSLRLSIFGSARRLSATTSHAPPMRTTCRSQPESAVPCWCGWVPSRIRNSARRTTCHRRSRFRDSETLISSFPGCRAIA